MKAKDRIGKPPIASILSFQLRIPGSDAGAVPRNAVYLFWRIDMFPYLIQEQSLTFYKFVIDMSDSGYKIFDQEGLYFITFSVIEWVDVFTRAAFADIVVESLNFCSRNKGLAVHAWVLMPNHFHAIFSAKDGYQLSGIIRDFKRHTAKKILKDILTTNSESRSRWMLWLFKSAGTSNSRNEEFQFWQQDNHPVALGNSEMIKQRLKYLHENLVRAGLVWENWHYRYSSAIDYENDQKGLVDIEFLY